MEWIIALTISAVGIVLATTRSTWLVDYAIFVFVLNRGLRRVVDFYINHAFNPLSPISLTPIIIAGAMAVACLVNARRFPKWASRIFLCFGAAATYAFVIGYLYVQLGALYALGEVMAAISLAAFALIRGSDDKTRDRWMRSFAWAAILTSAYGWYQYLSLPPWDVFWVREVGFEGYLGELEATKMAVFATMSERGPLGVYLGFTLVPMIVSSRWRTVLSWPGVALVLSVLLLTGVRAGVMIAIIGTMTFLLVNRGANMGQVGTAVVVLSASVYFGFGLIPGSDRIADRLATMGNIQQDGSFQGRVELMSGGAWAMLQNPLGAGFGAGGLGTRVNTGTMATTVTWGDAGYFQIALIYGSVGTLFLLRGLYLAWKWLALHFKLKHQAGEHVMLARALIVTMIPACWVGDVLTGFSPFWLALGCGLGAGTERIVKAVALLKANSLKRESARTESPVPHLDR